MPRFLSCRTYSRQSTVFRANLEIDFVIRYNNQPTLVEVKSTSGNTKSANYILNNYDYYHVKNCIKLGEYNIGFSNRKLTIPYYLAFLLFE